MEKYDGLYYDSNYVTNVKKDKEFLTFRFSVNMHSTYIVNHMSVSLEWHEIAYWDQTQWIYTGVRIEPKQIVVFLMRMEIWHKYMQTLK